MNNFSISNTCDRQKKSDTNTTTATTNRGPRSNRLCTQCGTPIKTIISPSDYTYKRTIRGRRLYFCSWDCMRHYERESIVSL